MGTEHALTNSPRSAPQHQWEESKYKKDIKCLNTTVQKPAFSTHGPTACAHHIELSAQHLNISGRPATVVQLKSFLLKEIQSNSYWDWVKEPMLRQHRPQTPEARTGGGPGDQSSETKMWPLSRWVPINRFSLLSGWKEWVTRMYYPGSIQKSVALISVHDINHTKEHIFNTKLKINPYLLHRSFICRFYSRLQKQWSYKNIALHLYKIPTTLVWCPEKTTEKMYSRNIKKMNKTQTLWTKTVVIFKSFSSLTDQWASLTTPTWTHPPCFLPLSKADGFFICC